MPSYLQLEQEEVWHDQFVPDNLTALLIEPLRDFYGMDASSIGAPGDNNHTYGRHRSANWDRQSLYCTNRSYGTTDSRDHNGDQDIYRAVDVGIQGETLHAASHRMDALVRSGTAPGVAEWFGTYDGQTVVGWYEGSPSTSDDSHLWHLHVGFWNGHADDPQTLAQVYAAITGEDMALSDDDVKRIAEAVWLYHLAPAGPHGAGYNMGDHLLYTEGDVADIRKTLTAGGGTPPPGPVNLTPEAVQQVAKATADEIAADPERDGADT